MSGQAAERERIAWSFRGNVPVEVVRLSRSAGQAAAADGARNIYVIDRTGAVQGQLKASQSVRRLMAADAGDLFVALAGEGFIYAFDQRGQLEWRTEFDEYLADCDLGPSGGLLAAVTAEGTLCVYRPETRETRVAQMGLEPESLAIVAEDPGAVAVGDSTGRLALVDLDGQALWEKALEMPLGPVACDAGRDTIAVPAFEQGVLLFRRNGEELGRLAVPGAARRAAVCPGGRSCVVETNDACLLRVATDGTVLWRQTLRRAPADWTLGSEGSLVAVAKGGREVVAYLVPGVEEEEAESPARESAFTAVEEALQAESEAPSRVLWRRSIGTGAEGSRVRDIRLVGGGEHVVFLCADGTAAALDREGTRVLETSVDLPAWFALQWAGAGLVLWNERGLVLLEPAEGRARRLTLKEPPACLACSADLGLLCMGMEDGQVRVYADSQPAWARRLDAPITDVHTDPGGGTVVTADASGRFSFFSADGRLRYKFRMGDIERARCCGLGDGFAVFSDEDGLLLVLSFEGEDLWEGRPLGRLAHVEVLPDAIAAYRAEGACALVDPRRDEVTELWPPPGEARVRRHPDGGPVLLLAEGRSVTAYTGRQRKLEVLWRVRCDGQVTDFRVDPEGRAGVALAGGEMYLMEATD